MNYARNMRCWLFLFVWLVTVSSVAQRTEVCSPYVKTMQWLQQSLPTATPTWRVGDGAPLTFTFDVMSHEAHTLRYEIDHCSAMWESSALHPSEYLEGIAQSLYLEQGVQSFNTDVLYTHYALTLPNAEVVFRLSGNYKLSIYDEDSLLCTSYFAVVEPQTTLQATATADTDKGHYSHYQQIEVEANHSALPHLRIARDELHLVVVPNGHWAKAVYAPPPSMTLANALRWTHHPQLIFDGGNEYRKFEILHTSNPYQGVEHIAWQAPYAHAYLYSDEPRQHYLFDKDYNGRFIIRHEDDRNNATESQYMVVHFTLNAPFTPQGHYYIVGDFNCYQLSDDNRMRYDATTATYYGNLLLKQGYYNYAYAYLPQGAKPAKTTLTPAEGSFYQTENEYTIYLYQYRNDRGYDALVGYTTIQYTP